MFGTYVDNLQNKVLFGKSFKHSNMVLFPQRALVNDFEALFHGHSTIKEDMTPKTDDKCV